RSLYRQIRDSLLLPEDDGRSFDIGAMRVITPMLQFTHQISGTTAEVKDRISRPNIFSEKIPQDLLANFEPPVVALQFEISFIVISVHLIETNNGNGSG